MFNYLFMNSLPLSPSLAALHHTKAIGKITTQLASQSFNIKNNIPISLAPLF